MRAVYLPTAPTTRPRRRTRRLNASRIGVYAFLLTAALFFLLPLYIMLTTSFKSMDEIRLGHLFALPLAPSLDAWRTAWSEACTGVSCEGVRVGFWNSAAARQQVAHGAARARWSVIATIPRR